jgi:hypothetical protein
MATSTFPRPTTKPHQTKVYLSDSDRLALAWLTQTTGSSLSGIIRGLIRDRLNELGIVPPVPSDLSPAAPSTDEVER